MTRVDSEERFSVCRFAGAGGTVEWKLYQSQGQSWLVHSTLNHATVASIVWWG